MINRTLKLGVALVFLVGGVSLAAAERTSSASLPFDADTGECFARVLTPAKYETKTNRVMVKPDRETQKVIPAKFAYEDQRVMVREETEKLEIVPTSYRWVDEKVMVKPASRKITTIPAKYKTTTEKVVDTPAHSMWKKGRGPIEKLDNSTGDIMCKVEVPATYKTVTKQVLVEAAKQKEVEIPAVYKTVRKQVIDKPATVKKVKIPAKYNVVKVQKLVTPSQVVKNKIPAEFKDLVSKVRLADSKTEWKPILCETNMSKDKILQIQQTLKTKGYNVGQVDGVFGSSTQQAIKKFQQDKKISTGNLTLETLKMLGLDFG